MHFLAFTRFSLLFCGLLVAASIQALPLSLGSASNFNTFVLGDMNHQHSDVEGRLAVGGDLTLSNYAIGMRLTDADNDRDSLVVGGALNFTDGRIYHGHARSGGTANLNNSVGFYTGEDPSQSSGKYFSGNPLDFTAAATDLRNRSKTYGGYDKTGEVKQTDGFLQLIGEDPLLNVFSLSMEQIVVGRLDLITPGDAWTLINVRGGSGKFAEMGIYFGDADHGGIRVQEDSSQRHDGRLTGRVLFNFFEATELDLYSIAVPGSILAPLAQINFYNGHVDGQLIAGSLSGHTDGAQCSSENYTVCSGQSNWYPFKELVEESPSRQTSIPEPVSLALLLGGLATLLLLKGRRSNQTRSTLANRC